ncbi:MAG TPA: ATP-binding cassette domain-containing protein [Candidatus Binatia bacterium]|nr:ATP-binding cassette domain-containing protein [Candidatus Binatia bacterium]
MSVSLLRMEHASFGYSGRIVLSDVDIDVARGDVIGIVGPNGAGKTTLLRALLGLVRLRTGRLLYGFDRRLHPPGYVPQRERLDPAFPLTAYDVVLMAATARVPALSRVDEAALQRTRESLERVGMLAVAHEPFATMSGGQKQRVLIARALAVEPEVLLLDEPTAGLDSGSEDAVLGILETLNREQGMTILLVSHHHGRMRRFIRSIVQVQDGRVMTSSVADAQVQP